MDVILEQIKKEVYDKCGFILSDFKADPESIAYNACSFYLNERKILYRNAKVTPKKSGQFVTFWKRSKKGPIEPFNMNDPIDFYVVTVKTDNKLGQFVFPKSILITKGIISTDKKEGKRAFRVYPIWHNEGNAQAKRTQKWQLDFFYEIHDSTDLDKVKQLYINKKRSTTFSED